MPTPLITSAHYPAIRAAVDTSLDAATLPDATLALPIFVPAAIDDVLAADPGAEARTDPTEVRRVQNAAIYYAAARVVVGLPSLKSERFDDYAYTYEQRDPAARAADLRGQAAAELARVLVAAAAPATALRPTIFTVAGAPTGVV
jgi:hypothetical protein